MKLLVFAHTPPPLHGQSLMVATLLDALRNDPAFEVHHVNVRLSSDLGDVGRWRVGKLFTLARACATAWRIRLRHGPMAFYYVPAPGKRGAVYRDWLVMALCRPFFAGLVLHWHAVGLGAWLQDQATVLERWLTQRLLGCAELALVLAPELAADASILRPKRVHLLPNCVPDPFAAGPVRQRPGDAVCRVIFVGLCTRAKGIFDLLAAVAQANEQAGTRFELTIVGGFPAPAERAEFDQAAAALPAETVRCVGEVPPQVRDELLVAASVFCFPTQYAHEGQPLVIMEALAHDLPIIATRWRGIPSMLPTAHSWLVAPGKIDELADALVAVAQSSRPNGTCRAHYVAHFTPERHAEALKKALRAIGD